MFVFKALALILGELFFTSSGRIILFFVGTVYLFYRWLCGPTQPSPPPAPSKPPLPSRQDVVSGRVIATENQWHNVRVESLRVYKPLHTPRVAPGTFRKGYCTLHFVEFANYFPPYSGCEECRLELGKGEYPLPEPYTKYTKVMFTDEEFELRMQDKYVQMGALTEREARENKQAFMKYCLPFWQHELDRRQQQQREGERLAKMRPRERAPEIW